MALCIVGIRDIFHQQYSSTGARARTEQAFGKYLISFLSVGRRGSGAGSRHPESPRHFLFSSAYFNNPA